MLRPLGALELLTWTMIHWSGLSGLRISCITLRILAGISTEPKERFTADLSLLFEVWATMITAQSSWPQSSNSLANTGRVSFARNISIPEPRKAWNGSKIISLIWYCLTIDQISGLVKVSPAGLLWKKIFVKSPPLASILPRKIGWSSSTERTRTFPGVSTVLFNSGFPVETWAATAQTKAVFPLPESPWINVPFPLWKYGAIVHFGSS